MTGVGGMRCALSVALRYMQALQWLAGRPADQAMAAREEMIAKLEDADKAMRASAMCAAWYDGSDVDVKMVAGDSNGHLFEQLLVATEYCHVAFVEQLRGGALACVLAFRLMLCCVFVRRHVDGGGVTVQWYRHPLGG